jgi:hypothetical protein
LQIFVNAERQKTTGLEIDVGLSIEKKSGKMPI